MHHLRFLGPGCTEAEASLIDIAVCGVELDLEAVIRPDAILGGQVLVGSLQLPLGRADNISGCSSASSLNFFSLAMPMSMIQTLILH